MRVLWFVCFLAGVCPAEIKNCSCSASRPETLEVRECSLDREVAKQADFGDVVFLKDNNPRKANRTLAIPRANVVRLSEMTAEQRTEFWTAALAKARELWGEDWGVALNGELARTQCHLHVHIGRLLDGGDPESGEAVAGPAQIPLPEGNTGLWIQPYGGKLLVHLGQQINETVLKR